MNPFTFPVRRPFTTLLVVGGLAAAGVFGLKKMRAESYPEGKTPKVYVYLDLAEERYKQSKEFVMHRYESYFGGGKHGSEEHVEEHKIVATSPKVMDVVVTQQYVCQIHSQKSIEIKAFDEGYLTEVAVREGQMVKHNDLMFQLNPVLYEAEAKAARAKALNAKIKYDNTKSLASGPRPAVSQSEVMLLDAEWQEAQANQQLAEAKLRFASIRAPFDGRIDRLHQMLGSLVKEDGILTTMYDNSVMWVYFNVPEARYLEYMAMSKQEKDEEKIELILANGNKFDEPGRIGTIEGKFNNETGNIAFRADFPNPDGLLRHGQTGTIMIHRTAKDAMVIPQRCTFENLAKRYVYVIDKDEVAHQREITILYELEDIFVIKKGVVAEDEKVVLEGVRQIRDGEKVESEFRSLEEVMKESKNPAE